jgi:hypothetical protein
MEKLAKKKENTLKSRYGQLKPGYYKCKSSLQLSTQSYLQNLSSEGNKKINKYKITSEG